MFLFLYCPSYLSHLNNIGWATWAIWPAIKKYCLSYRCLLVGCLLTWPFSLHCACWSNVPTVLITITFVSYMKLSTLSGCSRFIEVFLSWYWLLVAVTFKPVWGAVLFAHFMLEQRCNNSNTMAKVWRGKTGRVESICTYTVTLRYLCFGAPHVHYVPLFNNHNRIVQNIAVNLKRKRIKLLLSNLAFTQSVLIMKWLNCITFYKFTWSYLFYVPYRYLVMCANLILWWAQHKVQRLTMVRYWCSH